MLKSNLVNKDFNSANKRYIYNVEDYIIIKNLKERFTQDFIYKYRGKRYSFLFINLIKLYLIKDNL